MDLQISVFLLFILFTAGHSLNCYECVSEMGSCVDQEVKACPELHTCFSLTTVAQYGDNTIKVKVKDCLPYVCISGYTNFSIPNMSFFCCDTDLCNAQDAPDPSVDSSSTNAFNILNVFNVPNVPNDPNGKRCYYCDGLNCSNIIDCSGIEDRCIKETGNLESLPFAAKGCISKDFCDYSELLFNGQGITCCEGDLCNSVDSVTHNDTKNVTKNQSVTQSVFQNNTQSVTESVSQNDSQNVTQSVSQNNTQSLTQNVTQSPDSAESVTQSFLFLCCSLLSFILLH